MKFLNNYIHNNEPSYARWVIWCWHQPIYFGLPLIILSPLFLVVDGIIFITYLLVSWGRQWE